MITEKTKLGNKGENLVTQFLKKQSFKILEQNYRTKFGEVDIIAQKKDVLAFVEVKTRKNEYFPTSMVVNYSKQKKIINAAKHFILKNNISDVVYRFDIATVIMLNSKSEIKYLSDAFRIRTIR